MGGPWFPARKGPNGIKQRTSAALHRNQSIRRLERSEGDKALMVKWARHEETFFIAVVQKKIDSPARPPL